MRSALCRVDGDMQLPVQAEQGTQVAWTILGLRTKRAIQSTVMTAKSQKTSDRAALQILKALMATLPL